MKEWARQKHWEIFIKQEHERAKTMFRSHVSSAEANSETMVSGWNLYDQILKTSSETIDNANHDLHLPHVLNALRGESSDTTPGSLAHFAFRFQTFEPMENRNGILLEGLEGRELEKAISFCRAMDEVGWRPGDLQEKYPES